MSNDNYYSRNTRLKDMDAVKQTGGSYGECEYSAACW
jgi:hypothetical protein